MEFDLQNYECSLCKQDKTKPVLHKHGLTIVICSNCGFVYVNPRLKNEQLNSIYLHNYFKNKEYGYIGYELQEVLRKKNFERWLKDAASFLPGGKPIRALDVGCAAGYCLDIMKSKGWDAEGLELEAEMFEVLMQSGYSVSKTRLEELSTAQKYSVITLFDVIEHIPDLDKAFQQLFNLLEEDGIIIIVTPDHNSIQRKIFRKKWFQYKPIEHIQYFSRQTLIAFAGRNGLDMVVHKRSGQYADTNFIVNRLQYYQFSFLSGLFNKIFSFLRLKNIFFYIDTGSLFTDFKKK